MTFKRNQNLMVYLSFFVVELLFIMQITPLLEISYSFLGTVLFVILFFELFSSISMKDKKKEAEAEIKKKLKNRETEGCDDSEIKKWGLSVAFEARKQISKFVIVVIGFLLMEVFLFWGINIFPTVEPMKLPLLNRVAGWFIVVISAFFILYAYFQRKGKESIEKEKKHKSKIFEFLAFYENKDKIKEHKEALDKSSEKNHNLAISFLLFLAYVIVTAASISDSQLLIEANGIPMPFLGISVPVKSFFFVAPIAVLVFYVNILANFSMHARKLRTWHIIENEGSEDDLTKFETPFFMNFTFSKGTGETLFFLYNVFHFSLVCILPMVALSEIFIKYGKIQDGGKMTIFHIIILIFAVGFFLAYRFIEIPAIFNMHRIEDDFSLMLMNLAYTFLGLFLIVFSFCYIFNFYQLAGNPGEDLKSSRELILFDKRADFEYFLNVRFISSGIKVGLEKVPLDVKKWFAPYLNVTKNEELLPLATSTNQWVKESSIKKFDLTDRKFNRINLSGAFLHKVDFSYSKLRNANFSEASLQEANFFNTDLRNANFSNANLEGADFSREFDGFEQERSLKSTNFSNAKLQCTNFSGSDFNISNAGEFCVLTIEDEEIFRKNNCFEICKSKGFIIKEK